MKSFIQHLHEIADHPYQWKRTKKTKKYWEAKFKTNKKGIGYTFEAAFYDEDNIPFDAIEETHWQIHFEELSKKSVKGDSDNFKTTGSQGMSAGRVLATIKEICDVFVKETKPNTILFSANKKDGKSREKIYSRFAKQFAKNHNYDYETYNLASLGVQDFILRRKKNK
jgi:hypothetical protein